KSFAVFARRKYGFGKIRYQLFPDQDVHDFETFVLRQSGNDNQSTHLTYPRSEIRAFGPAKSYGSYFVNGNFTLFRDAMLGSLGKELGLDTQSYRPAVVYLNGKYWGIYNIREKLNEHYLESHFGVPATHPKRKFLVVSQWRTVYITELDKRKQITLGWVSSTD
ncbi:CotH kinase family protein, partial [Akkermansiaceae bacterium]|nr:CotH kinase family protein [Akkermansiaceae bacterium]